ncbi:hypothetical protein HYZ99_02880 [Candidatus Peregrinibacteria bacterium]|nr:hypothetical protein [Candidatus Peregrinibacteria bacterium]
MPFSRSRVTPHQVFLAKIIGVGLGILLGIALSIRMNGIPMMRFHADSMYSPAPVYGQLQLPIVEAEEVMVQATAASSSSTRRATRDEYWRRNPRPASKQRR